MFGILVLVAIFGGGAFVVVKLITGKKGQTGGSSQPLTPQERDAVLMDEYHRKMAKYQRKLQAFQNEANVARSAGVSNAAFSNPPRPPKPPVLSSHQ
jgi:hypothetical protein